MLTFLVCLTALVIAYFTYGRYLERVAAIDPARSVPSETLFDGVDYVPMPRWRVFLIQLLNIAGTGPIFGAILGAAFGPVAFLWITLGGIFMGAMHDFLSGVMLVRNDGLSIPEVAGRYLGTGMRQFMRLFSVVLLVLVGAVFLLSPADILSGMVPSVPHTVWVWLIWPTTSSPHCCPSTRSSARFIRSSAWPSSSWRSHCWACCSSAPTGSPN